MNNYNVIGLYDHNASGYDKVKLKLSEEDIAAIVRATGTGKSYIGLQLAYDNKPKKIMYIVPSKAIIEHLEEIINENPNLDFKRDFPNLEFRTYQSLIDLSEDEIKQLDIDILILDEFHHIGAPVWGEKINLIIKTHKNIKVLGMTAYTVRDRGTSYERDMVNPDTNEIFSGKVVSNYSLVDAMIDGVLPKPIYKSAYVNLEQTAKVLEKKIENLSRSSKDYKELSKLLKDIKMRIHESPSVKDIFKTNIKKNGKYIYFCPLIVENGKNDITTIMEEAKTWVMEMGLSENDYEFYVSTSAMGKEGKQNRKAFYNDEDLEGNKTNNKLRIMFAINQYNEGVHAPGLDGVIMGRGTNSDIVFFEQLGRALSVRGRTKEEYDELYSKSVEELVELCKRREIKIDNINEKEELIEQLLSPTIIDLSNNIDFIKNLENDLKNRVKEITTSNSGEKRIIHLGNTSFDIDMINQDLFEILKYINDRLTMTWMDKYELAKKYYEQHGNLEIPQLFKTINGYEYNENGIALGSWISTQRQAYNGQGHSKITEEQIKLLKNIGMRFETVDKTKKWMNKYNLAKSYYEHHGNLEIQQLFKTINGYEYDENGIALGVWITTQRQAYKGQSNLKISEEQIKLLKDIGMRFEIVDKMKEWMNKYNLAKVYYDHNGNLGIPYNFKTINGYEYDENGIALGKWITNLRQSYKGKHCLKLSEEQIKLLESIGMRFETVDKAKEWMNKYNLAKIYYEHNGNLKIPQSFKTINGYEYDKGGIALGIWIHTQRQAYNGQGGHKITEEQIKLLESIGMKWFNNNVNYKSQSEKINENNIVRKKIEILNRVRSYLNELDGTTLLNKNELNKGLLYKLNHE